MLLSEGRIADALHDFDAALFILPTSAHSLGSRGMAYVAARQYNLAIKDLERADEIFTRAPRGHNDTGEEIVFHVNAVRTREFHSKVVAQMGWARLKTGDFRGAVEDFGEAFRIDKNNAHALDYRGLARYQKRDCPLALEDFNMAIHLQPTNGAFYNNRAMARICTGDSQGAIADLKKAIAMRPDSEENYASLGTAYMINGDLKGALENFAKSLAMNPSDYQVHLLAGRAHSMLRDGDAALDSLASALQLKPMCCAVDKTLFPTRKPSLPPMSGQTLVNPALLLMYGDDLVRQKRVEEALEVIEVVLSREPGMIEAHFRRGLLLGQKGVRGEALSAFGRALSSGDPKFFALFEALLQGDPAQLCRPIPRQAKDLGRDDLLLAFLTGCERVLPVQ